MKVKSCLLALILCAGMNPGAQATGFIAPSRYYDPGMGRFLSPDEHVGDSSDPQQLNRYAYVRNNPLIYVDPSGNFITAVLAGAVFSGVIAGAQTDWNYDAMGRAALIGAVSGGVFSGVSGMSVFANNAFAGAVAGGAASGVTAGGLHAGMYGGNIGNAMLQGGAYGALGGAVFHGMDRFFHANPAIRGATPLAHGVTGGTLTKMSGGNFADGFYVSAGSSLAMMGWESAREFTNRSSARSQEIPYKRGDPINSFGARGPAENLPPGKEGFLPSGKNIREGTVNVNTPLGRYGNRISKVHDFMNSYRYNHNGKFIPFNTRTGATMFQIYNYGGMPPAALYTSFAFGSQAYQPALTIDFNR